MAKLKYKELNFKVDMYAKSTDTHFTQVLTVKKESDIQEIVKEKYFNTEILKITKQ